MLLRIQFILILLFTSVFSQSFKINKIEPPNWWSGMKNQNLQLMVYGENLNDVRIKSVDKHFKINHISHPENSSYLFVDISLKNATS